MNESECERSSPEPPEFDERGYVIAELRYIFDVLDRHGIDLEEAKEIIEEVIKNEF